MFYQIKKLLLNLLFYITYLCIIIPWLLDILVVSKIIYNILFKFSFDLFIYYVLLYFISIKFEHFIFFHQLRSYFKFIFSSYFKFKIIDDYVKSDKPTINIIGPHGMLMNSGLMIGLFHQSEIDLSKSKLFVAPILTYNPIVNIIVKILTLGSKVYPLNNKVIKNILNEGKYNLTFSGGGFEEMNFYTNNKNIIYTGRWKYWIKNAIIYGYDIDITYCYNGNRDYKNISDDIYPNIFHKIKLWCCKYYIPFNFAYGKYMIFPFNDFTMYQFTVKCKLPFIKPSTNINLDDLVEQEYKKMLKSVSDRIIQLNDSDDVSPFILCEKIDINN